MLAQRHSIILCLCAMSAAAHCEEAITLSGRRVILNDDGTWKYKIVKEPNEVLFRGVPWGATQETIKKHFPRKPIFEQDNLVIYEDHLRNLKVHVGFVLANKHFVRGMYRFQEQHTNNELFFSDYDQVKPLLWEKYGEPKEEEKLWLSDFFKDDPQRWDTALAMGQLAVYSKWLMNDVTIVHSLRGDNFEVEHVIEYSHKAMGIIEDALRKEEDKSKL